jgi:ParB family transcriptional regulator, chromosome partitioning protein
MIITELRTDDILSDSTFNCRGAVAPIDVVELAKDIENHGLQQPIVVQPFHHHENKYNYRIVSGHRRHKAFQVLKKEFIPCIVNTEITEAQALVLNLTENIHRRDLNIMQEAAALERLKMAGLSVSDVAGELGKSHTWVNVRYMLLELPVPIREAAAAGYINQAQVRQIHSLKEVPKQLEAARKIKDAKLRGEKTPAIKQPTKKRNILKPKQRDQQDIFWMQNHIQESVGNNIGTRCLAWAAGEISDFEIFQDVRELAHSQEISYEIPYSLGNMV